MTAWTAFLDHVLPLGAMCLGMIVVAAAIGQRLCQHGHLRLSLSWLAPRILAGLAGWGLLEIGIPWTGLDAWLSVPGPESTIVQTTVEILILALLCVLVARIGPQFIPGQNPAAEIDATTPKLHGSKQNDPFGSIRDEPWEASTASAALGGFLIAQALGLATALVRLFPLPQIEPVYLVVQAADVLNLAVASALVAWAWQRLLSRHPKGFPGGLISAWLLRWAFLSMMQGEFPWPILGVLFGAVGLLSAWRYIGDIRIEFREKTRRKGRKRPGCDDC